MIKLILIMLLVWVGFAFFKKLRQPTVSKGSGNHSGQKMVACSVCDTHIPESEAILKNGKIYCSKEHLEE